MQNMKVKQSVEYNGKRYTLPFLVAKESLSTKKNLDLHSLLKIKIELINKIIKIKL